MNSQDAGDQPKYVRIKKIVDENPHTKTFFLDYDMEGMPGQFAMLWLPGFDEKPMSVSYFGKEAGFTVEARGRTTKKMFSLKEGDRLGVRGPYGKPFTLKDDAILVGGGVGMPPMAVLAEHVKNPIILQGARSKDRLMFQDRLKDMDARYATDDGSFGHKGFVTDLLEEQLKKKRPSIVYTCGPELMMKKVVGICKDNDVPCEVSLERYMRCGYGICGSCVCGEMIVCRDGPVFSIEQLEKMDDFGKKALLVSGRKGSLKEYSEWRS